MYFAGFTTYLLYFWLIDNRKKSFSSPVPLLKGRQSQTAAPRKSPCRDAPIKLYWFIDENNKCAQDSLKRFSRRGIDTPPTYFEHPRIPHLTTRSHFTSLWFLTPRGGGDNGFRLMDSSCLLLCLVSCYRGVVFFVKNRSFYHVLFHLPTRRSKLSEKVMARWALKVME